jgi:hypothetical protein
VIGALLEFTERLPRVRTLAHAAATVLGPAQSTYTATLISDTAIPVWHEARRDLPFVFAASSAATAGAAAATVLPPEAAGPARRLAVFGAVGRLATSLAMRARLRLVGEVYGQGEAGMLARLADGCTTAGAALLARRGERNRAAAVAGGALVLGGELAMRWSIFRAGFQSARDPKYVVALQRERKQASVGTM